MTWFTSGEYKSTRLYIICFQTNITKEFYFLYWLQNLFRFNLICGSFKLLLIDMTSWDSNYKLLRIWSYSHSKIFGLSPNFEKVEETVCIFHKTNLISTNTWYSRLLSQKCRLCIPQLPKFKPKFISPVILPKDTHLQGCDSCWIYSYQVSSSFLITVLTASWQKPTQTI